MFLYLSEEFVEQVVDVPGFLGDAAGSSAASLDTAEELFYGFFALFPKAKKVRQSLRSRLRSWVRSPAHPRRRLMAPMTWCFHGCSFGRVRTRSSAVVMCGAYGWSLPCRSTTSSGRTRVGVSGSPLGCPSPVVSRRCLSRAAWSFPDCSADFGRLSL